MMKPLHTNLLLKAAVLGAAIMGASLPPVALAGPVDAQGAARRQMRAGMVRPLAQIERRVLPMMRGHQYLGPEYDKRMMAYRLKFIRDGVVTFVDVDARSGEIISRTR